MLIILKVIVLSVVIQLYLIALWKPSFNCSYGKTHCSWKFVQGMHSFGSLSFTVKKMIFCRCIIFLIKRISSPVSLFHYAGRFPVIWYHSVRSRDNVPLCEKGWIDEFWVVLEICILWRSFDLIAALDIKALDAFTSLREDSVVWHLWSENWRVSCSLVMRWAAVYSGLCLDSEKYLIFWCTLQNVDFCPPKTQLLTDNKILLRYETIFKTSSANALLPPHTLLPFRTDLFD